MEILDIKEKNALKSMEAYRKEAEKLKTDRDALENLVKALEIEIKKTENKLAQEQLKSTKLSENYTEYKEKSAEKFANVVDK